MKCNEELLKKAYALGFEYEATRGACSQCVLAACQETIGGVPEDVFRAAQGLSGGTVSCGSGTCGALAGGIMLIGLKVGRTKAEFDQQVKSRRVVEIGRKLADRFIVAYGGITCAEVQAANMGRAFDMADAQDLAAFNAQGGHAQHCASVAGNGARWTIEILDEAGLL